MNAMTIFIRCREADDELRAYAMRIQQRRDALTSITAPPPDPNGGSHARGRHDKIPSIAADIGDIEAAMHHREERKRAEIAAACVLLDCLPVNQSRVMNLYYVQGFRVAQIAKRLNFSDGYIRKLKVISESTASAIDESVVDGALPSWYLREEKQND